MRQGMNRSIRYAILLSTPTLLAFAGGVLAQGLPPIQREFSNGSVLTFYGQINKGILSYDDGRETKSYFLIDNDNSGTRAGISYTQEFDAWTFENVNEFGYAPYSTSTVNIEQDSPTSEDYEFSNANIRKLDFSFANDQYGKFWLGQGSMATDGILEIDRSGTDIIAYSGVLIPPAPRSSASATRRWPTTSADRRSSTSSPTSTATARSGSATTARASPTSPRP